LLSLVVAVVVRVLMPKVKVVVVVLAVCGRALRLLVAVGV